MLSQSHENKRTLASEKEHTKMTLTQLYMAIGIPLLFNGICFTAIFMMLSWLKDDIKNTRLELKDEIKGVEKRLTDRIDRIEDRRLVK
jgi:hypothetical protein